MSGTKTGGLKAAKTNLKTYGEDYYKRIGKVGGASSRTGGFYYMMQHNPKRLKQISTRSRRPWTAEHRQHHSERMKAYWESQRFFVPDNRPFSEGFNKKSLFKRLIGR